MKNFDPWTPAGGAPAQTAAAPQRRQSARAPRRLRALWRLMRRAMRARATYEELRRLDAAALHDLGLTPAEAASVAAELGGRVAPSRRITDPSLYLTAPRMRVREVDSSL